MNVGLRDHHTVDLLRELHWLPVRSRIIFKIATLCHRVLQDSQPTYLARKVDLYRPTMTLCSSEKRPSSQNRRHEPRPKRACSRVQRPKCGNPSPFNTNDGIPNSFQNTTEDISVRRRVRYQLAGSVIHAPATHTVYNRLYCLTSALQIT